MADIEHDDIPHPYDAAGAAATATSTAASALTAHAVDTTAIHGIADTSALATSAAVTTDIATHSADTTAVHGIADTSALATTSSVTTDIATHAADTTSVHGIADTSVLVTATDLATHASDTTNVHGIVDTSTLGGAYQLDVTEDGSSFANFTSIAGSWASDGTVISSTGTGSGDRARHATAHPQSLVTYDVRIPSGGTVGQGGLALMHNTSFGDGDFVKQYLADSGGTLDFTVDRSNVVGLVAADTNLALDTWHTIKVVCMGIGSMGWWVNGVFVGWNQISVQGVTAPYTRWGIWGRNGIDFKNIKLYSPRMP